MNVRRMIALVGVALLVAACGPGGGAAAPTFTPWPTRSPIPGADQAAKAVTAFAELIANPDLSYQVSGSGLDTIVDAPVGWTLVAHVSGAKFSGTAEAGGAKLPIAYSTGGEQIKVNGKWYPITAGSALDDIVRPWQYVCGTGGLRYTGPGERHDTYAFGCDPGYVVQTLRMRLSAVTVTVNDLTLVLDADGKPVTLKVAATYSGNTARLMNSISLDLAFSKVGKPVTISKP
jgi:hypothetical protein